jgi:hypothetical protein
LWLADIFRGPERFATFLAGERLATALFVPVLFLADAFFVVRVVFFAGGTGVLLRQVVQPTVVGRRSCRQRPHHRLVQVEVLVHRIGP